MIGKLLRSALLLGLLALALSCGSGAYHRGRYLMDRGMFDEAVVKLEQAQKKSPHNLKYKTELVRAKLAASQKHVENAKHAMAREEYSEAATELEKAIRLDPGNQYAKDMLDKIIATEAEKEKKARQAKISLDQMKREAEKNTGVPKLDPASNIPIVLKFKSAPLHTILDAISKASGINFLYDDKTDKKKRVTVDFAKVSLEQVLDYLMMQTKNFYKVIDPHTLIIVSDTKQKREEYEEQVIRTFYLSNANVKDVFQLVRSILQVRKMAMNQELNSITIQDTPEHVAVAQRIIENNDKSKGEIVVDVELLEVNSSLTRDLGINLSDHTFTIGPRHNLVTGDSGTSIGSGPPVPLTDFGKTISHSLMVSPIPNLIVNMLLSDSDSQILAKPQLRVMEGQKAMVHIGDRIPIPTSQQYLGAQGTGINYTPMTSYTYQDIGVKIELEPRVHHNKEVTIKLKTEVSSVTGYVKSPNNLTGDQPIIGTREANTTIRLEDGETSLLAGLIRKEDKRSLSGLPGISEVPILRRLFSDTKDEKNSTDVVMLVTPHILRMPNITEKNLEPLYVGTKSKANVKGRAGSPFAERFRGARPMPSPRRREAPAEGTRDQSAAPGAGTPGEEAQSPEEPQVPTARILMSPTNVQVKVGDPLSLNLVIIGAKDVKGMHAELTYPLDVLQFQGADEGTFFKMGGANANFSGREMSPGAIALDAVRLDNSGASGSGMVARLRFTAKAPGEGRVALAGGQLIGLKGQGGVIAPGFALVTVQGAPPPKTGP